VKNDPVLLFEADTPIGFTVRVTRERWLLITTLKHPVMAGCEEEVRATLETPEQIHRSQKNENVFLFYRSRRVGRWVCAVSKRTGAAGFLITAYPTDAIKEGEKIWPS
jgi:hypothetical protein